MLRLMGEGGRNDREGARLFGIPCEEGPVEKLAFYATELERWNERVNLTGLKDTRSIVELLLYDAFFLQGFAGSEREDRGFGLGRGRPRHPP